MKHLFFFILLIINSVTIYGQSRYYTDPVKIPMLLSGSFAELRSNHFHSGIDIKTQGVTGIPVYAVAQGYVSRIVVSPGGYGKALYINHPNGTTSVYGHLQQFSDEIEHYVKAKQYEKKSFRVDLHVPRSLFRVEQDEEIGKSGNTGSSGGPHLHFEIRDTQSEEPLNPLLYGFPVADNTPPKIFSLLVVPLSDDAHVNYESGQRSYPVVFYDGKYHLKNNPVVPVYGEVGFAVQTNDYFDGVYNKCGINSLRFDVDGETQFTFKLDRFAFHETRYINSHFVYDEYIESRRKFLKTWIDPGNKLRIYNYNFNNGRFRADDNATHNIEIEVSDTYGNRSSLVFRVEGKKREVFTRSEEFDKQFVYNRANRYRSDNFEIEVPQDALYKNLGFRHKILQPGEGFYSGIHEVHNKKVPLHKPVTVKVKANIPGPLQSKAVLAAIDEETGDLSAAGGKYRNGWVEAKVRNFGTYAVVVDTIAPEVTPLSIENNSLTESNRIRFRIKDDLSGINKIEGLLDGKWALFEYDPKTATITHYFDSQRFEMNKRHDFKLTVTDNRGNETVYRAGFWK